MANNIMSGGWGLEVIQYYDALRDETVVRMSDGSIRRMRGGVSSYEPAARITTAQDAIFASLYPAPESAPTPVVEKSPEEMMEDALDAAVRAARKAV